MSSTRREVRSKVGAGLAVLLVQPFGHVTLAFFAAEVYESGHRVSGTVHPREPMSARILIVDDDRDVLVAAKLLLKRRFDEVVTADNPAEIPAHLEAGEFDAILLDMNFAPGERSGREGLSWLDRILEIDPDAVVVLITAHSAVDTAVEAMKHGAIDFVAKPWQNQKLIATLNAAVVLRRSRTEAARLRGQNRELAAQSAGPRDEMFGESEAMQRVFSIIAKAAPTDANVLITGENGTGKDLVAREIHRQSARAREVFMSVDLGALAESLAESELFGHRKGAFTGAGDDRVGRFAAASGGTLFLDEIGNIPRQLQAKLLTALERREVVPVGANTPVAVDVRVISATNLSRAELGDESIFRQDLLYRLNTVEIGLPPLRDRGGDIALLTRQFTRHYARKYGREIRGIAGDAMAALAGYPWPGNVRALRHAVERAVILAESDVLARGDFPLTPVDAGAEVPAGTTLAELEKAAIAESLRRHIGNISYAAKELGITRTSLYRRMEKYGL
jgi:DNA-binding NtrC family response regulator